MRIVRTVAELRDHVRGARTRGATVGLVPTMGALHRGHASLIVASAERTDVTVVSLFVNPRQFGDAGDLDGYPRTEEADAALASAAGADVLFAPSVDEVYPPGFGVEVRLTGPLTSTLEGAHRGPEHFHGVTTVVAKLLGMVGPDVAFFGAKDAQQVLVVRRMVRDLDLPVAIEALPTVREPDGLALSSRNVRLSAEERARAVAIPQALRRAAERLAAGQHDAAALESGVRDDLAEAGLPAEYAAVVDPSSLEPRSTVRAPALLALAVPVGPVRLIDNVVLTPEPAPASAPDAAREPAAGQPVRRRTAASVSDRA